MKTHLLAAVFAVAFSIETEAQSCFEHFKKDGEAAFARRKFEVARKKFAAAKECPEASFEQRKEAEKRMREAEKRNLDALELEINRTEAAAELARQQAVRADSLRKLTDISLKTTEIALKTADSLRIESEKATRRALANEFSFKAQTALRDGDRTTAFRLAEFAYRSIDSLNERAQQALLDVFYQNDNRLARAMPWRRANFNLADGLDPQNMRFSSNGQFLYAASLGRTVKIWEINSSREIFNLLTESDIIQSACANDASRVAISSRHFGMSQIQIWKTDRTSPSVELTDGPPLESKNLFFTKNGQRLVVIYLENTVAFFDAQTGKMEKIFKAEADDFRWSATRSPDEKWLFLLSFDRRLRVVDLETGEERFSWPLSNPYLTSMAYSLDNQRVAIGLADRSVSVWSLETGRKLNDFVPQTLAATRLSFSMDGNSLTTFYTNSTSKTWSLLGGLEVSNTVAPEFVDFYEARFSRDGSRKLISFYEGSVGVFDMTTGKKLSSFFATGGYFTSFDFSPDGRRILLSESNGAARILDAETGKLEFQLPASAEILQTAFTADSRHLALARAGGYVDVWSLEPEHGLFPENEVSYQCVFSPDSKKVVINHSDSTGVWLRILDSERGNELFFVKNRGTEVEFSPDSHLLATYSFGGDSVFLNDASTGVLLGSVQFSATRKWVSPDGQSSGVENATLYSVRFSTDGSLIDLHGNFGADCVFDIKTGQKQAVFDSSALVLFSPDGKTAALLRENQAEIQLVDFKSGVKLGRIEGQEKEFSHLRFSPDGQKLLLLSNQKEGYPLKIWDVRASKFLENNVAFYGGVIELDWLDSLHFYVWSGNELASFEAKTMKLVGRIPSKDGQNPVFSPDFGKTLTFNLREARVTESISGNDLFVLRGHTGNLTDGQFSPDGRFILTTSDDKTAILWDARTGREWLRLRADSLPMNRIKFAPNGKKVAIFQGNGVGIWQLDPAVVVERMSESGSLASLTANQIYDFNLEEAMRKQADFERIVQGWPPAQSLEMAIYYSNQADAVSDSKRLSRIFRRAEILYQTAINQLGSPSISMDLADLYSRWMEKLLKNGQSDEAKRKAERVEKLYALADVLSKDQQIQLTNARFLLGKTTAAATDYCRFSKDMTYDFTKIQSAIDLITPYSTDKTGAAEFQNQWKKQGRYGLDDGYIPMAPMPQSGELFDQKKYAEATAAAQQELGESLEYHRSKDDLFLAADGFGNLSFYAVLAQKFDLAKTAGEAGMAIDSSKMYILGNLAHALLFSGKANQALEIYKKLMNTTEVGDLNGSSFKDSLLQDFELMSEAGMRHRDFPRAVELVSEKKLTKEERAKYEK